MSWTLTLPLPPPSSPFWSINTLSSAKVGCRRRRPWPLSVQQSSDLWGLRLALTLHLGPGSINDGRSVAPWMEGRRWLSVPPSPLSVLLSSAWWRRHHHHLLGVWVAPDGVTVSAPAFDGSFNFMPNFSQHREDRCCPACAPHLSASPCCKDREQRRTNAGRWVMHTHQDV